MNEPILKMLLLCDYIHVDETAIPHRPTFLSVRTRWKARHFPTTLQACLYYECSDLPVGYANMEFRIVPVDGGEPLMNAKCTILNSDPIVPHGAGTDPYPIEFPSPGVYLIEVLFNGNVVADRRFLVDQE